MLHQELAYCNLKKSLVEVKVKLGAYITLTVCRFDDHLYLISIVCLPHVYPDTTHSLTNMKEGWTEHCLDLNQYLIRLGSKYMYSYLYVSSTHYHALVLILDLKVSECFVNTFKYFWQQMLRCCVVADVGNQYGWGALYTLCTVQLN